MFNFKYNGCIKYIYVNFKKKISLNVVDFVCNVCVLFCFNVIMCFRI